MGGRCKKLCAAVAPQHLYVASDAAVCALRMSSIEAQVTELVTAAQYEEAIALCALCAGAAAAGGIDVAAIHAQYAHTLLARGDFEGAPRPRVARARPTRWRACLFGGDRDGDDARARLLTCDS